MSPEIKTKIELPFLVGALNGAVQLKGSMASRPIFLHGRSRFGLFARNPGAALHPSFVATAQSPEGPGQRKAAYRIYRVTPPCKEKNG